MISCRNVFIYFETELQYRILDLFYKSLCPLGYLCLGNKETIRSDAFRKKFKVINQKKIYTKKLALDPKIKQQWQNLKSIAVGRFGRVV
jgi:chemotaxis methyl-accepting protein methylase